LKTCRRHECLLRWEYPHPAHTSSLQTYRRTPPKTTIGFLYIINAFKQYILTTTRCTWRKSHPNFLATTARVGVRDSRLGEKRTDSAQGGSNTLSTSL
jgi:hypothetical protein